jgi:hypothetical protein
MDKDNKSFLISILEKLSEVSERTIRMEVEQTNMKEDLEQVKLQDVRQNQLLAEHIAGVQTAQARLDNEISARKLIQEEQTLLKSRVAALEEDPKFRATLKQHIITIGAVSAAVVALIKALKMLNLI